MSPDASTRCRSLFLGMPFLACQLDQGHDGEHTLEIHAEKVSTPPCAHVAGECDCDL